MTTKQINKPLNYLCLAALAGTFLAIKAPTVQAQEPVDIFTLKIERPNNMPIFDREDWQSEDDYENTWHNVENINYRLKQLEERGQFVKTVLSYLTNVNPEYPQLIERLNLINREIEILQSIKNRLTQVTIKANTQQ